ncbi:hypothetical protein AAZX31_17G000800 [Glycine max]|uniref:Uncharacterized protein n=4 Tax=Glycine subgen. Soja TaxID=1462606 RepID=I1MQS2_SOYBN|nr:uncharacterized protein LOC100798965 [Glycine max]XP_028211344.1 uncharacterized protein LOC114394005 [Glycine soja]KAG4929111.1 hypothetical protein JHK86_046072 [Glycine max]KAG4931838.1 hypothetical protein JHK87_045840 [Glycine soja]KAG4941969.1 hypothetical protein JHK85_046615 [Glycine max]KAG5096316.1 hypothetical protein JHK82_046170 [Glycine max]KAG5101112.1 hypothetical protein JHK84_046081 [Glycine max]|eukprot:XP_014625503.1 uncharacterized protein LOC100798965 [Glycine max]
MSATVTLTLNLCRSSIVASCPHYSHKPNPNFNAFFSFSLSLSLSHHRRIVIYKKPFPSRRTWLYGYMNRDRDYELENGLALFGSDEELATQIPTQAQSLVEGSGSIRIAEFKPVPDVDYLQELLAIQQQGPRAIGFFGTRNMGFMHQELIEILSYAMVITKNHIYTSGASGTNAAVIRGALRAEKPELLTVILPQSLSKQPPESQELLSKVKNVIEKPHNDHLPLIEASRLCNMDIISHVQQVICFAFHDSRLLMETCQEAKNLRKIVTLFYLD